jgi:hypothetical protein
VSRIDTTLRQWCAQCGKATVSAICQDGHYPVTICTTCRCPFCLAEGEEDY